MLIASVQYSTFTNTNLKHKYKSLFSITNTNYYYLIPYLRGLKIPDLKEEDMPVIEL